MAAGTIINGQTQKQKEKDEAFLKQVKKVCTKKAIRLPAGYSYSFEKWKKKQIKKIKQ